MSVRAHGERVLNFCFAILDHQGSKVTLYIIYIYIYRKEEGRGKIVMSETKGPPSSSDVVRLNVGGVSPIICVVPQ